jgi:hypothetical protein
LGNEGIVPETIMIKGPIGDQTVSSIETYLKDKYVLDLQ